jgi:hypothetical protein
MRIRNPDFIQSILLTDFIHFFQIFLYIKSENYVVFSLGNPVELSKPVLVSNTQQFKVYAIKSDSVIEPTFHPCLQARV